MAAPIPHKPQIVSIVDGGAIVAWLGTYPAGTTFNTYWAYGSANSIPPTPFVNLFSSGLKARTDSFTEGNGIVPIPRDSNIYISVTSFMHGVESAQSDPIFLSICNSAKEDQIAIARDESNANKLLRTDEKGRLFVVTDSSNPAIVTEAPLIALAPVLINVSTSSILLPSTPAVNRQMIVLQNQGTNSLFVGLTGSELYEIDPKQTLTFTVGGATEIAGKRNAGSGNVCIWEYTL
jgi:hypothetical protein